jgi:methyltransferase (TIGR00027 family)
MSKRRIETKTSRTASYTCFARGCATRGKDPRFRGPDYMAEIMFPPLAKLSLNLLPLRKFLMRRMFPPGIYEYVLARTKVMDSAFIDALEARFAQIVLLGAGFDTRALRFADQNRGTKVIELDVATTQQPKIEILRRKKVKLPQELVFASIDFDKQDLF